MTRCPICSTPYQPYNRGPMIMYKADCGCDGEEVRLAVEKIDEEQEAAREEGDGYSRKRDRI